MDDPKIVEFKREGWRDVLAVLKNLVAQLESGEQPEIIVGAIVTLDVNKTLEAYGFGPQAEALQVLALLALGQVRITDAILGD